MANVLYDAFPVDLPALTFDAGSLAVIDFSQAARNLFQRKFGTDGALPDALQLLSDTQADGTERDRDDRAREMRDRLASLAQSCRRLRWGQTIALEYYPEEEGEGEVADVLVSHRRTATATTVTVVFLRPSERPPKSRSLSASSNGLEDAPPFKEVLASSAKKGSASVGGAHATASMRSGSFSSTDKRSRPLIGKERENLPISAEAAYGLLHATARVSADTPAATSPPSAASPRLQSPVPTIEGQTYGNVVPGDASAPTIAAPRGPVDEASARRDQAKGAMQQLWDNSPLYRQEQSPENKPTEPDKTLVGDAGGEPTAEPGSESVIRIPRDLKDLTDLVETQPQITFLADAQGQVEWLNDAWYRYTGLDNRYHPNFERWMQCFHPDDLPQALEVYLGAMKSGEPFRFDYRVRFRDGNMRWNVCHGRPKKDAEGNVLGWVASIFDQEDVMQARHSALLTQERIKAVLEASQTLLISVNTNLEIDFLEGSLNLPDVVPNQAKSQQSTSMHCHLQDFLNARTLTEAAQKIVDGEETEIGLGHEFTGAEGQKSYVRFRLVPIRGDPSIPATSPDFELVTGVIIVGINVTEAVKVENELQKSRLEQVELESREKAKTDFLTTMSHELRTPSAQILLLLELVLADTETPLSDNHRSLLEQAIRSGDALLELIGAVLDVRKVEAGELELETQPFLLSEVIEDARLFSVMAQAKGLRFEEEIGDFYQGIVLGDRLRLRQVLTNALSNAVKFTAKGEVVLRVRQTSETDDQLSLQVDIEDSGVGIEESVLPTLFQPFRQAHAGTAREFGGTGLGLVISKKLVELMNGQIELISEYGHGSTFRICVPISKAPAGYERASASPTPPSVPTPLELETAPGEMDVDEAALRKRKPRRRPEEVRVLLAEDNKLIRDIVTKTLKAMKFHVDATEDGYECLEQLEKEQYDVILMDGQMPRLDGYEATRLIRQNPNKRGIRIIALTASAISGDRERCLAAGMDGYLAKPVRRIDLERAIFEQVDRIDGRPTEGMDLD